jgi:hypothetical protein
MKKVKFPALPLLIVFSLTLCLAACGGETVEGEEHIHDVKMEYGLGLLGLVSIEDGAKIFKKIDYMGLVPEETVPAWRLAQWGTKFNLADGEERMDQDVYNLKDNTKDFRVHTKTGEYSLDCYTADEYPTPRVFGQAWPHFIVSQDILKMTRVGDAQKIIADLDYEVTFIENLMSDSQFTPELHTALFQWVFIIRNENKDSLDYGQYIWLNIPYYDARYERLEEDVFLDFGKEDKSDTFIYTADTAEYLPGKANEHGERHRVKIDLVPYVERALTAVADNNENSNSVSPMLKNTTLDDLRIQQFYIGWEITGTFNAGLHIYSNSLRYVMTE